MILCRLGKAYGRTGNYEQMQHLLGKAADVIHEDQKIVRRLSSRQRLSFRWN